MAISDRFSGSRAETPLLLDTVDDAVDFKGRPVLRCRSGGWRAAAFIIGKIAGFLNYFNFEILLRIIHF